MIQHYFVSAWVPTQGVERENYTNTVGEKLYAVGSIQQMDMGRTSCGFAGTILPRHIGQSGSRAGFHAFRFAVAKEALAGFLFFAVEAHHVPRTGLLAESAADALVFIHIVGAGLGIDVDGTLRAGIGAGDRVSALAARVLIDGAVAPDYLL